ncbi:hypothetical protein Pcinc_001242 [Petrolisthes cinctipes]|uniref:Uncharacterized protein n=1 Tax=Petrolisthes cinctipes TaxID=88211 RepID=A0AAE1GNN6_PETCI|nr:hypothetical protein Pcinc_001242 [Petrolisthes cinctipes]
MGSKRVCSQRRHCAWRWWNSGQRLTTGQSWQLIGGGNGVTTDLQGAACGLNPAVVLSAILQEGKGWDLAQLEPHWSSGNGSNFSNLVRCLVLARSSLGVRWRPFLVVRWRCCLPFLRSTRAGV